MNRKSLVVWGGIVALLVVSALLSAMWPSISAGLPSSNRGSSGPRVETEIEPVHLTIPAPVVDLLNLDESELEFSPFLAIGVMAAIAIGGIVVVGGGLAFLYTRLDATTSKMMASEAYQSNLKSLEELEKQRLTDSNADKTLIVKSDSDYEMPRWSVISTGFLLILFIIFIAAAISDTVYPEREVEFAGRLMSAPGIFIGLAVLVSTLVMAVGFRPKTLAAINGDEASSIPWDLIYLLVTGFIIIVAGTGLILWFRQPIG